MTEPPNDPRVVPLTAECWDDFTELFATNSITRMCWCMYPRVPAAEFRTLTPQQRKRRFAALVKAGPPPGLLAYRDDKAVAWMALAPRPQTPDWNCGRKCSAVATATDATDPACWGASCFFVHPKHRGEGLTSQLLAAGIVHAREQGATRIEASPMAQDDKRSSAGMFVGPLRIFERAGFTQVLERKPGRPLMRLVLKRKQILVAR